MRTVVDKQQVAHFWANQTQSHARTSTGAMFFEGPSIYSYGYHFEIARIVEHRGKKCVLFTTRDYSTTTAAHKRIVRQACSHLDVIYVDLRDLGGTPGKLLATMRERYKEAMRIAAAIPKRAPVRRARAFSHAESIAANGDRVAEFFGLTGRIKRLNEDEAAASIKAEERRQAAVARKRDAEIAARFAENLPKWLAGEENYLPSHSNTYFRFIADGEEIQTSHGARFHTKDGKRAYKILKALHKAGKTFQANGEKIPVGPWQVDSMDEHGNVKAGCHFIEWTVIEEFAQKAGW